MIALALYFSSLISPVDSLALAHAGARCEELGPRSDGRYVTVCDGSVVRVRDALGNSREWNLSRGTITARSVGGQPVVLD
jgi:hypothetical protein